MQKNVAGQKLTVFVFNKSTNAPVTGDAANLTGYVSINDGAVTALADTSATEQSVTHAAGYYLFDLAQAETNGDKLAFFAVSSTLNVIAIADPAVDYPTAGLPPIIAPAPPPAVSSAQEELTALETAYSAILYKGAQSYSIDGRQLTGLDIKWMASRIDTLRAIVYRESTGGMFSVARNRLPE